MTKDDHSSRATTITSNVDSSVKHSRINITGGLLVGVVAIVSVVVLAMWVTRGSADSRGAGPVNANAVQNLDAGAPPPVTLEAAIALAADGRSTESLRAFTELAAREPANAVVLANLCGAELQAGQGASAEASCRAAIRLAPANWLAHYNLACALALSGRADGALESLSTALMAVANAPGMTRAALAEHARSDAMLQSLHGRVRFENLTRAQEE